jgi:fic/DOC family
MNGFLHKIKMYLSVKEIAELFGLSALFDVKYATVSERISNILASGEPDETSVGFLGRSTRGRKTKIYKLL